jgi:hypothetical protein
VQADLLSPAIRKQAYVSIHQHTSAIRQQLLLLPQPDFFSPPSDLLLADALGVLSVCVCDRERVAALSLSALLGRLRAGNEM